MTGPVRAARETRLPLSYNQELLCMFDSGSTGGPFGPRYHIVVGRRLAGPLCVETLRAALTDVVARHEPLRTNLVRTGERYQRVFPPSPPRLEVREAPGLAPAERDRRAEALMGELEADTIEAEELPHLRAVLLRFDERDAMLVLLMHHTATDGWSIDILVHDLLACYAGRRAGTPPQLPPMRPYRDFVSWEREVAAGESAARARAWWAENLRGARFTALPADHRRSAGLPPVTAVHRFDLGPELLDGVRRLARAARCSPFMALLAAYFQLVGEITGTTDIVVSTHTLGRPKGFENTVGSFFNFLPLRVDIAGCRDVRDLVARVRAACVGAYQHEIPAVQVFEAAPDLMAPAMADHLTPVTFQVFPASPVPRPSVVGGLTCTTVHPRAESVPVTSDIPDGAVWSINLDPSEVVTGDLAYRTDRFERSTILRLVEGYRSALESLVAWAERAPADGSTVGS